MEGYYSQPVCVGLIVPCVIVACMRGAGAGMRATAAAMRAAVVRASACACNVLLCKSDAGPPLLGHLGQTLECLYLLLLLLATRSPQ